MAGPFSGYVGALSPPCISLTGLIDPRRRWLVKEAAREDRALFREAMASILMQVAPKNKDLHVDPQAQGG